MEPMYFIGIDLAFSPKNNSGVTVLRGLKEGGLSELRYNASRLCKTDDEIVDFIVPYLNPGHAIVAVDAPLVVPNQTGMRPCEKAIARVYGKRQCAAYPSHQGNMAGTRGPNLLSHLTRAGVPVWTGVPIQMLTAKMTSVPVSKGREVVPFMETYPHAAHLAMFDLPTVWKYKKKSKRSWASCQSELAEYWKRLWPLMPEVPGQAIEMSGTDALGQRLVDWGPSIHGNQQPPDIIGKRYKEFEDLTDGLFCAYVAAHVYVGQRTLLFSSTSEGQDDLSVYREGDGFIVVPSM